MATIFSTVKRNSILICSEVFLMGLGKVNRVFNLLYFWDLNCLDTPLDNRKLKFKTCNSPKAAHEHIHWQKYTHIFVAWFVKCMNQISVWLIADQLV